VAASFFFAGPKKHLERLKVLCHIVASVVLLLCIIMIFVFAFCIKATGARAALVIITLLVEIVALIFFYVTLNKIMWAAVKAFLSRCFPCC
jgi:membrane-anchored glycerophosphoryl diester phosphodiesterase (GDPDase)